MTRNRLTWHYVSREFLNVFLLKIAQTYGLSRTLLTFCSCIILTWRSNEFKTLSVFVGISLMAKNHVVIIEPRWTVLLAGARWRSATQHPYEMSATHVDPAAGRPARCQTLPRAPCQWRIARNLRQGVRKVVLSLPLPRLHCPQPPSFPIPSSSLPLLLSSPFPSSPLPSLRSRTP